MRHRVLLEAHGGLKMPKVVAEIGPGDSIGVGLAALIAGAERYYGFDVMAYSIPALEQQIFEELVELFAKEEPIPGEEEFPSIKPRLDSYAFPSHIFSKAYLKEVLLPERIERLREALKGRNKDSTDIISYKVPWSEDHILEPRSVDWIFSQAVLEHVEDLEQSYTAMANWLKPGGVTSHQIDFRCHGASPFWNGHWAFSPFIWKLIKGSALYLLNRKTYEDHVALMKKNGFHFCYEQRSIGENGLPVKKLAAAYRNLSAKNLETSGAFIIGRIK